MRNDARDVCSRGPPTRIHSVSYQIGDGHAKNTPTNAHKHTHPDTRNSYSYCCTAALDTRTAIEDRTPMEYGLGHIQQFHREKMGGGRGRGAGGSGGGWGGAPCPITSQQTDHRNDEHP